MVLCFGFLLIDYLCNCTFCTHLAAFHKMIQCGSAGPVVQLVVRSIADPGVV